MGYGILMPPRVRRKQRALLNALYQTGIKNARNAKLMSVYNRCGVLMLYGWGGDHQQRALKRHKGAYVAFDLGYWSRDGFGSRKWRVSVNGFHCPAEIMKGAVPSAIRLQRDNINVAPDQSAVKPPKTILLVGNSEKSNRVGASGWAAAKSREIKTKFPHAQLIYRPKPNRRQEANIVSDRFSHEPIESALKNASLVVCRHSNVAVDACRAGVPVVCEDGAAAAIYPSELSNYEKQPDFELRREFLVRLSWWQWSINDLRTDAAQFWDWLSLTLSRAEARDEVKHRLREDGFGRVDELRRASESESAKASGDSLRRKKHSARRRVGGNRDGFAFD